MMAISGLAPAVGQAASVQLTGDKVDLAMGVTASQPDAPVIAAQADLNAKLQSLQTQLQISVQAGQAQANAGPYQPLLLSGPVNGSWNSGRVGLGAAWEPSSQSKLEFSADNQISTRQQSLDRFSAAPSSLASLRSLQSTARLVATFTPAASFNVQAGGQATDHSERSAIMATDSAVALDVMRTQGRQLFGQVQWRPVPSLSLEGGGQVEAIGISWAGAEDRSDAYAFVKPRVAGTLTHAGASLQLNVERAVSAINTDQFLSFAEATTDRSTSLRFEPDQEWRYQAALQQKVGAFDLTATVTQAQMQSVTDLGPVGTGQAPVNIGAGQRSQIEAAVAGPLQMFGLPALTVSASGVWRDSQVADPFTGTQRRLSGETPYEARLTVGAAARPAAIS